jgi:hypothetical protein
MNGQIDEKISLSAKSGCATPSGKTRPGRTAGDRETDSVDAQSRYSEKATHP